MQPVIKKIGELKVVGPGSRYVCILSPDATSETVIPKLWDNLIQRMGEIRHAVGETTYGLSEAIAESERSHPEEFYYIAAQPVESLDDIPEGMECRTVPEGTYAVFTHVGRLDTLGETINYIHGSWAPNSGYELRPGPELELYDKRFDPASDTSEMEICIPVKEIYD